MKYYVYKLTNQYGETIYIGQTNNLTRRFRDHQKGLAKVKRIFNKTKQLKGKQLYRDCVTNNWRINSIVTLKTLNHRSVAKMWESSYILSELLHKNNTKLTNSQLDKTRIFKHLI